MPKPDDVTDKTATTTQNQQSRRLRRARAAKATMRIIFANEDFKFRLSMVVQGIYSRAQYNGHNLCITYSTEGEAAPNRLEVA